jgi:hypothetical protein
VTGPILGINSPTSIDTFGIDRRQTGPMFPLRRRGVSWSDVLLCVLGTAQDGYDRSVEQVSAVLSPERRSLLVEKFEATPDCNWKDGEMPSEKQSLLGFLKRTQVLRGELTTEYLAAADRASAMLGPDACKRARACHDPPSRAPNKRARGCASGPSPEWETDSGEDSSGDSDSDSSDREDATAPPEGEGHDEAPLPFLGGKKAAKAERKAAKKAEKKGRKRERKRARKKAEKKAKKERKKNRRRKA